MLRGGGAHSHIPLRHDTVNSIQYVLRTGLLEYGTAFLRDGCIGIDFLLSLLLGGRLHCAAGGRILEYWWS